MRLEVGILDFKLKKPFTIKNNDNSRQIKIRNIKKPPSLNRSAKGFNVITASGNNTNSFITDGFKLMMCQTYWRSLDKKLKCDKQPN